jgi:hypothetical protein
MQVGIFPERSLAMDQEREKLARQTAEKMIAECEVIMVGGCPACPGYHPENRCPACVNDAATIARLIDTALEQWGDLRAEQVRRETVEADCKTVCATLLCTQFDKGEGRHFHECLEVTAALRRAFAASQGGTHE